MRPRTRSQGPAIQRALPRRTRRQAGPRYKPNDNCHRHRLPDNRPKNNQVAAYSRRKP